MHTKLLLSEVPIGELIWDGAYLNQPSEQRENTSGSLHVLVNKLEDRVVLMQLDYHEYVPYMEERVKPKKITPTKTDYGQTGTLPYTGGVRLLLTHIEHNKLTPLTRKWMIPGTRVRSPKEYEVDHDSNHIEKWVEYIGLIEKEIEKRMESMLGEDVYYAHQAALDYPEGINFNQYTPPDYHMYHTDYDNIYKAIRDMENLTTDLGGNPFWVIPDPDNPTSPDMALCYNSRDEIDTARFIDSNIGAVGVVELKNDTPVYKKGDSYYLHLIPDPNYK